ncbi:MAG: hypothetical protein IJU23_01475 [Proteobacteria bacterium]|nr:hypothetical protein [Pseudomonadota bacterium]
MSRACWKVINVLHDALKSIYELEVNAQATKADDTKADNAKAKAKAVADAFLDVVTMLSIKDPFSRHQ